MFLFNTKTGLFEVKNEALRVLITFCLQKVTKKIAIGD